MGGCASTRRNTCSLCAARTAGNRRSKWWKSRSAPPTCWRRSCRRRWTGAATRSRRSSWVPRYGTRGGNSELIDSRMFMPTKAFLTKGVGRHKEKLTSFEMALRDAHLANFNLVRVSSIFPPHCELVDREEGLSLLQPGQVVFAVIAESSTNEPSRLVAASIGVAMPADPSHHGYISEHHSYGQNESVSGEYAEDLAASMLATVLGVPFEPGTAWDERREQWLLSGEIVRTMNVTSTAECGDDGRWTTVVSAGSFCGGSRRSAWRSAPGC